MEIAYQSDSNQKVLTIGIRLDLIILSENYVVSAFVLPLVLCPWAAARKLTLCNVSWQNGDSINRGPESLVWNSFLSPYKWKMLGIFQYLNQTSPLSATVLKIKKKAKMAQALLIRAVNPDGIISYYDALKSFVDLIIRSISSTKVAFYLLWFFKI